MSERAYSVLEIKSVDDDTRTIEGIASTPEADRGGHIMVAAGARFRLPLPFLWQHRQDEPIGEVISATPTKAGIVIRAQVRTITEAGPLQTRIDEAWQSLKHKLVRGLSIGWRPLDAPEPVTTPDGVRLKFGSWEWLELSAVTLPMNAATTITAIKSVASKDWAASGRGPEAYARPSAGDSAPVVTRIKAGVMNTIQEQIRAWEATRAAKDAERASIMTKAADTGATLDAKQAEEHDTLTGAIENIDAHLKRLRIQEASNVAAAAAVKAIDLPTGAAARTGQLPVISVKSNVPPGIEFARMVMVKIHAKLDGLNALELARARYPDHPRIGQYLNYLQKAAVPAATTTDPAWLGGLVDPTNLSSEFIEWLRPRTIIGQFGVGGVPSLNAIPFNVRILGQTSGGQGYWVGQGAAKPLTKFNIAPVTLGSAKVANIAVLTEEIVRFSSPSAEALVRNELARALIERLDIDFIDPAKALVPTISPASITNGLVPLVSSGSTPADVRADLIAILNAFVAGNQDATNLVLIMPTTIALALSLQVNALGQSEFATVTKSGGSLQGIPIIASQYAAAVGNIVVALNADEIFLADDGQVTVDMSREASLQMADDPSNNSATANGQSLVSMFQTNSVALRAERFINWQRRRDGAVVYMSGVQWGGGGSPAL